MVLDPFKTWDARRTSRAAFFNFFRRWASKVRPEHLQRFSRKRSLFASRNKVLAVREAARRKVKIRMSYKRVQDDVVKAYFVEPYSWRVQRTRLRPRTKVLYAYHPRDKTIKNFIVDRIMNVYVTNHTFQPRWPVEIR